jgi:8-oxo-dGTP pyrophosphatase MutT (NUDIX family)
MTEYRRASTICIVRDNPGMEVLMVQRPHTSRFMPSTWVFPGGAVDEEDAAPPPTFRASEDWRVAALRETAEEVGLWLTTDGVIEEAPVGHAFEQAEQLGITLDGDDLIYFSNWLTPEVFPIRFDTRFFLAVASAEVVGAVDGDELVDLTWISPLEALRREDIGEWDVAFPTRKTLEVLASEPTADSLAERLRSLDLVPTIQPRLYVSENEASIVMPGEDLYDAIEADQADPDILSRLAAVVAKGGHLPAEFKRRG